MARISRIDNTQKRPQTAPLEERVKVAEEQDGRSRSQFMGASQRVDFGLVICLTILLAFGMVTLFSASMSASVSGTGQGTAYIARQALANGLGIGVIFIITKFNIKTFDRLEFALILYVFSLLLLGLTYFTAPINGAKRWLTVPLFGQFQPSEFAKVVLVYTLACYFSWLNKQRASGRFMRRRGFKGAYFDTWFDIFLPMCITMIPAVITLGQPHFSGMIIIVAVGFVCLLAAGIPIRNWLVAIGTGMVLILALLFILTVSDPILPQGIKDNFAHVETRLDIFTGNGEASEAAIYQSRQSLIAMGSGGTFGVGLGQGKQKNNYLPEGHNDYIFSNMVEEIGFVGGMSVLVLFLIFFILGLRVTFKANSIYAQIVAGGITSLIVIQALLNLAVNVQVIPPTGISLPFFSYGGSSNLFFLFGVGLLLNVSKYGTSKNLSHKVS